MKQTDDEFSPVQVFLPAVLVLLLLRGFAFEIVRVEGRSMEPEIAAGATLLVNRLAYGLRLPFQDRYAFAWGAPERGDIVVLQSPRDGAIVVKRIFARAGDSVDTVGGTVWIRDTPVVTDVSATEQIRSVSAVPSGYFFVLGDNPPESVDSRHYGFVEFDDIRGRVVRF